MKKFIIFAPIFVLLFLFNADSVLACSCVADTAPLKQQVENAYKNSKAIFSAKVIEITEDTAKGSKVVKLKLTKSWKGKLSKTFTITTASDSAMCGFNFEKGKTYLVYASGKNLKELSTNNCTRTAEITANKDVAVLDKIKKKG